MAQFHHRAPDRGGPYDQAVARLEGIRRELTLAGGPAPDPDKWSDQLAGAAAAGLDGLAAIDVHGSAEASREMVDRIRRELAEIAGFALR